MRICYGLLLSLTFQSLNAVEWDKHNNAMLSRKRLVIVASKIVHGIETTVAAIRHRSWMYDDNPYYEIGYVFSVCMERYRKMVEVARIARRSEWPIYHMVYLLDMQQKHFLELYHTTNMLHEISKKYAYFEQFTHVHLWQKNRAYAGSVRDFAGKGGIATSSTKKIWTKEELEKQRQKNIFERQNMKTPEQIEAHILESRSKIPSYGFIGDRSRIYNELVKIEHDRVIWKEAAKAHLKHKNPYAEVAKLHTLPWTPRGWWCYWPLCKPFGVRVSNAIPNYKGGKRAKKGYWDYGWEPDYEWWTKNTFMTYRSTWGRPIYYSAFETGFKALKIAGIGGKVLFNTWKYAYGGYVVVKVANVVGNQIHKNIKNYSLFYFYLL